MKILIGADICMTENNEELFVSGEAEKLVGKKLYEKICDADLRIFNLEGALTKIDEPIKKCGPNLKMNPEGIKGLKALKIDLLSVCNNHILDEGKNGFVDTIKNLDKAKIAHVGGGLTKEEGKKIHIFNIEGKKIGVYACCEHEFSWFDDFGYGCNGFDPLDAPDEIEAAKNQVDFLIVLYHGGREQCRYPFPYLKKRCRKMVDKGADFVVCQHTHCIGCKEEYKGGEIVYGQGNFLFCHSCDDEYWKSGLLTEITIENEKVSYNYIPYEQNGVGINYSNDKSIIDNFNKRNEEIKEKGFVDKYYEKYVEEWSEYYLRRLKEMADNNTLAADYINCEPHKSTIVAALKNTFIKKEL